MVSLLFIFPSVCQTAPVPSCLEIVSIFSSLLHLHSPSAASISQINSSVPLSHPLSPQYKSPTSSFFFSLLFPVFISVTSSVSSWIPRRKFPFVISIKVLQLQKFSANFGTIDALLFVHERFTPFLFSLSHKDTCKHNSSLR